MSDIILSGFYVPFGGRQLRLLQKVKSLIWKEFHDRKRAHQ